MVSKKNNRSKHAYDLPLHRVKPSWKVLLHQEKADADFLTDRADILERGKYADNKYHFARYNDNKGI
ncbi:hypothetical protein [Pantoea sp. B65]|uniref:hypothetical protein n=1 Tax=Pantoea sp. B65 TaxID=2813359 RepID=UPI0039B6925B